LEDSPNTVLVKLRDWSGMSTWIKECLIAHENQMINKKMSGVDENIFLNRV
jgi:hypothetical protein